MPRPESRMTFPESHAIGTGTPAMADRTRQSTGQPLELHHRHRPLHLPAGADADARGVRDRGIAADARQDAALVRLRGDRRRAGERRVQDAGQPAARICQPRHSAGADAGHPAGLPQAGDLQRARRAARGRPELHPAAARALSASRWCWSGSTSRLSAISSPTRTITTKSCSYELRSGALGASIKVGEFTTLEGPHGAADRAERG